ncbi:hypothetical protein QYE76_016402 [Lolium multiflorum]|uniref:Transposase (putative) gypsy type domain-containing protein n=1 Tax=Lolium multiflorum TaxID=4521 RepID=A0AAD8VEN4_LOLMU|nr:hypothetical protein QYE76_016402 [Lolium multiflorum]
MRIFNRKFRELALELPPRSFTAFDLRHVSIIQRRNRSVSTVGSKTRISALGLYITLARGNFSFFHLLTHIVFFLAPRRPTDLNSGEPYHGELRAPPVHASPRAKIISVDREIFPAADLWSREAISCKSGDLCPAGAPSSHRVINGMCAGLVEDKLSVDPNTQLSLHGCSRKHVTRFTALYWLAQPFSASSSTAPGQIPSLKELQEELEGQARMAAKVQETENKRASKARNREGERGQWWPCETTDVELRELQNEGMISAHWSFIRDTDVSKPGAGEIVMTKAWVERGLSLPCSEFFLSILSTYGLQLHNICPNSYLLLSNFATLCEGHLGIRPDVRLWQFFFRVKKETKDKAMVNCGSMTFMLRPGRMYPPHDSHESVRYWNAGWFYEKNASVPNVHEGLPKFVNEPPEELASWSFVPSLAQTPILEKAARRISWLFHDGLTGAQLTLSWFTRWIQPLSSILWRRKTFAILRVPVSGDAAEEVPDDEEEEEEQHLARQPLVLRNADKWELEQDLLNAMLNNAWGKPDAVSSEIQDFKKDVGQFFDKLICKQKEQQALYFELHKNIALQRRVTLGQAENIRTLKNENAELKKQLADAQGASSSLATTSSELENLRSSYQELETKLMEAEQKKEQAEKQLTEKNSELIKEKGEFLLKRNADSKTIKRQQKELNGLRKYMETAEHHWDLLNKYILEPLGYPEKRRNLFPRDDLLQLAGDDCKDLISASRKICHNLSIKRSRTCEVRKLVKKMDVLPELVTDLQASSARGAAAMTLTMCLAHNSELDLDRVTTGVPPEADVGALLDAVSGYDTRIARRIRHEEFYDKVVLPADEPLEAELQKELDAEARPAESGTQFTWTSSKDATQDQTKDNAATSEEEQESDEDVSSPAEDAEGGDPKGETSSAN